MYGFTTSLTRFLSSTQENDANAGIDRRKLRYTNNATYRAFREIGHLDALSFSKFIPYEWTYYIPYSNPCCECVLASHSMFGSNMAGLSFSNQRCGERSLRCASTLQLSSIRFRTLRYPVSTYRGWWRFASCESRSHAFASPHLRPRAQTCSLAHSCVGKLWGVSLLNLRLWCPATRCACLYVRDTCPCELSD